MQEMTAHDTLQEVKSPGEEIYDGASRQKFGMRVVQQEDELDIAK
jgi:hypothetical protein